MPISQKQTAVLLVTAGILLTTVVAVIVLSGSNSRLGANLALEELELEPSGEPIVCDISSEAEQEELAAYQKKIEVESVAKGGRCMCACRACDKDGKITALLCHKDGVLKVKDEYMCDGKFNAGDSTEALMWPALKKEGDEIVEVGEAECKQYEKDKVKKWYGGCKGYKIKLNDKGEAVPWGEQHPKDTMEEISGERTRCRWVSKDETVIDLQTIPIGIK